MYKQTDRLTSYYFKVPIQVTNNHPDDLELIFIFHESFPIQVNFKHFRSEAMCYKITVSVCLSIYMSVMLTYSFPRLFLLLKNFGYFYY